MEVNMKGLSQLSANQLFLYNTIAAKSSERAVKSIQKARLTAPQSQKLNKAVELLQS